MLYSKLQGLDSFGGAKRFRRNFSHLVFRAVVLRYFVMANINFNQLRLRLDQVSLDFDRTKEIVNDPISMVLQFESPEDREVAAFIAAVFSYGNVKQFIIRCRIFFRFLAQILRRFYEKRTEFIGKTKFPQTFDTVLILLKT